MTFSDVDSRSSDRRARDEAIASEPSLPHPLLPPSTIPRSMEAFQCQLTHPRAIAGIVENGMVRPLDPGVKLPEHSRVIIVASEAAGAREARARRCASAYTVTIDDGAARG